MTLHTRVYVKNPIDYRELFIKCNQLIGAHEGIAFTDEPIPDYRDGERVAGPEDGEWWIWNEPGQGLCALLDIHYKRGRPLRIPGEHWRHCDPAEDDCTGDCAPACWLEMSLDTGYSYRGPDGGCGDLHARLVAELGQWLDERGIEWEWENEFTGEIHRSYEGLTELGDGGAEASAWFRDIAAPAIAARMATGNI